MLEEQHIADVICKKLGLENRTPDLENWKAMVDSIHKADQEVTIGLVGKYVALHDAYLSVAEAAPSRRLQKRSPPEHQMDRFRTISTILTKFSRMSTALSFPAALAAAALKA